ncbi:Mariner Mos1 transposase, partial [Habropoda laboriosa]
SLSERSLGWEILPRAAHSPDLAPSDYRLFRSLQRHLTDAKFETYRDVNNSIADFIRSKPQSFFRKGIRQLPEIWNKCIASNGDYFQD